MKIRNLYLGCIWEVKEIQCKEPKYSTDPSEYYRINISKVDRISILYKLTQRSKYAIDIIYGGIYRIGLRENSKVGDLHIRDLTSILSYGLGEDKEYVKKNISKKKVLTHSKELLKKHQLTVLNRYEEEK